MTILDQLRTGVTTTTAEETRALAGALAAVLPIDTVLALHGPLGAGKTTFVQGLAVGFAITEAVTSPTFNLFTLHSGTRLLAHLDAYRLEHGRQMEALMLEDFLVSPWCLTVEWPEHIADWLPVSAWHLELDTVGDGRHGVRLR